MTDINDGQRRAVAWLAEGPRHWEGTHVNGAPSKQSLLALLRRGLAEQTDHRPDTWDLTAAGRRLLAQDPAPDTRWPPPRPMSEAPRDGTEILVRFGGRAKNCYFLAMYVEGRWYGGGLPLAEGGMLAWWPLPQISTEQPA